MLPSMPLINVNSQDSTSQPITELNHKDTSFVDDFREINTSEAKSGGTSILSVESLLRKEPTHEAQVLSSPVGEESDIKDLEFPSASLPLDGKGCEDELVLLADSLSADKRKPTSPVHMIAKKKKKLEPPLMSRHDYERTSAYFPEAFFTWASNVLDSQSFQKFVNILIEYEEKQWDRVKLYKTVCEVFGSNTELKDHFLGFLYPHEALECLFSLEYDLTHRAWKVFSYIEPNQFGKFLSILEQHEAADHPKMTVEDLLPSLKSLFRLQPQLVKCLASLFPSGPPPEKCESSYERVVSLTIDEEDAAYERVCVPQDQIKNCSSVGCKCPCHRRKKKLLCAVCNIRVVNGQIYVKRNKVMKLARVGFVGVSTEEMQKKLNPELYNNKNLFDPDKSPDGDGKISERKLRKSPSESSLNEEKLDSLELSDSEGKSSPRKSCRRRLSESDLNADENYFYYGDCDDDFNNQSSTGSDVESLSELDDGSMKSQESMEATEEFKMRIESPRKKKEMSPTIHFDVCDKSLSASGVKFQPASSGDLNLDFDRPPPPPPLSTPAAQKSVDPDPVETVPVLSSSRFEKPFQVDSLPQEVSEPSAKSEEHPVETSSSVVEDAQCQKTWTREEDKVILEAFQKEIGTEHTFSKISSRMPNRSLKDIQTRFQELMRLLEKIACVSHD